MIETGRQKKEGKETQRKERREVVKKREQKEEGNCAGGVEEIERKRQGAERKPALRPVNYSEEKGPSHFRSCFEHACLASPANGHRLTCYHPPPTPHPPYSAHTGSYQCSLVERVNNYSMTTLLCKLEGCLHKEKRVYFKRATGYFKKMGELFMVACSDVCWGFFLWFCVFGDDDTNWK